MAVGNFESGKRTTLSQPVAPADTTIYLASAPTVTSGRLYLKNDAQEERIDFTGVSGNTVTGCSRGMSQTQDPSTSGTGLTWIAGTVVTLVAMHDQLANKLKTNTWAAAQTFSAVASFTAGLQVSGTTSYIGFPQLTTAQRTALTPSNGRVVYDTTIGELYQYIGGAWSAVSAGSTQPNASTTVAGKVEMATQTETEQKATTGGTGAFVVPTPSNINPANITSATPLGADKLSWSDTSDSGYLKASTLANLLANFFTPYGDGSDGDVTISGTVTLTSDMYYNNLSIPAGNTLDPAGYRVFVKGTISGAGTINRNGNAGGNASGQTAGTAATTLNQGSLNGEVAAGAGGAGAGAGPATGANGTAGTNANPCMVTTNGAAGGTGGAAAQPAGTAGAAGTSTRGSAYNKLYPSYIVHYATAQGLTSLNYKSVASSGGGSGGGSSGGGVGGGGGGGGGNGGFIWIAANTWNFTGTITATGGAGGNGGNATGSAGGGGGGGGGNGGTLFRIYSTMTADCTKTLTAGTGGTGGTGSTNNGVAGSNGNAGTTIDIVI